MRHDDDSATSLPVLGRPVRTWGMTPRAAVLTRRRRDKVNLWSAVALQQHVALTASTLCEPALGVDDRTARAEACIATLPPMQRDGRLTLAQKMGLVPLPPPAPTETEWRHVVACALARESREPLGGQLCSICHTAFYATMDQGQIILSCSHVFHERCFRQFERFARRRPRAQEGGVGLSVTPLACPVCRRTHYSKRVYFAGKALAQRAAIIRIQAAIRGFCARRRYLQLRLQHNAAFRTGYVQRKLARLSEAWEAYLQRADAAREVAMEDLQARQEAAVAAYLLEKDWDSIIARALATLKSTQTDDDEPHLECAICLERVQCGLRYAHTMLESCEQAGGERAKAIVAELRREYERKRAAQSQPQRKPKGTRRRDGTAPPRPHATAMSASAAKRTPPSDGQEGSVVTTAPSAAVSTTRFAVILSCGHCYHDACLASFEQYMAWQAAELGGPVTPRCPLCRRGYAKHPL